MGIAWFSEADGMRPWGSEAIARTHLTQVSSMWVGKKLDAAHRRVCSRACVVSWSGQASVYGLER